MRSGTKLGVIALAMINVAAIVSVRNLPVMAEYGWAMLALFAVSIVVFLIPISTVAAELGTGWPKEGGVYAWVREAFGGRTGFLAVWCDYSENIAWFPTVLSFMAATFAYVINPDLATNKWYLVSAMLVFLWATTLLNLRGVQSSATIGSVGTVVGRNTRMTIAGESAGGMCALMLALRHPDTYSTFADLAGLTSPTIAQSVDPGPTTATLFDGSTEAYRDHDPLWLLQNQQFPTLSGWFEVGTSDSAPLQAQRTLVLLARSAGILTCANEIPGDHSYAFASAGFRDAFPWLAYRLGIGSQPPDTYALCQT